MTPHRNYPEELALLEEAHAALKLDNTALKKRVVELEGDVAALRAPNPQPPPAVSDEAAQILHAIAKSERGATGSALRGRFRVTVERLAFLLDELVEHTCIEQFGATPHEGTVWRATPVGRLVLAQRGLL